jgi:hypothetical protein
MTVLDMEHIKVISVLPVCQTSGSQMTHWCDGTLTRIEGLVTLVKLHCSGIKVNNIHCSINCFICYVLTGVRDCWSYHLVTWFACCVDMKGMYTHT